MEVVSFTTYTQLPTDFKYWERNNIFFKKGVLIRRIGREIQNSPHLGLLILKTGSYHKSQWAFKHFASPVGNLHLPYTEAANPHPPLKTIYPRRNMSLNWSQKGWRSGVSKSLEVKHLILATNLPWKLKTRSGLRGILVNSHRASCVLSRGCPFSRVPVTNLMVF